MFGPTSSEVKAAAVVLALAGYGVVRVIEVGIVWLTDHVEVNWSKDDGPQED